MRKAMAAVILMGIATAMTAPALAQESKEKRFQPFLTRSETTWSLSAGLRNNKNDWSEASDLTGTVTPNISVENTYRDIAVFELKGKVRHVEPVDIAFVKGGLVGEAELTGGILLDGFTQISAFAGNDRTLEALRRSSNEVTGDAIGGALTVGYQINLTGTPGYRARRIMESPTPQTAKGRQRKRQALAEATRTAGPYISITPLAGYGVDQQSFVIEEVFEVIPVFQNFNTDATYVANWYGPFFGLEAEIKDRRHMLRLRGQYHDLSFDGEFDDNVADVVREQEADGDGITLSGEYAYALGDDYALTFEGMFQSRETDPGTQTIRPANGAAQTVRLNEIDDESHALRLGVRYNWD